MGAVLERWFGMLSSVFAQFGVLDIIDIFIIAYMIYRLLMITRGTRATQVLKGLGVLLAASFLAGVLKLQSTAWMLDQLLKAGAIAIVVIFQPELRRALEQIGRGKLFERSALLSKHEMEIEKVVDEILIAMTNLSKRKVGALVVIERTTGLRDIISTGTSIEGIVSASLLENIFEPNTPLHDGAVIMREGIVMSAGCFLPLSDNSNISRELGTRHRAALGISEISDCLAIIVSEETGTISYASEGELKRKLSPAGLRKVLEEVYVKPGNGNGNRVKLFNFRKRNKKSSDEVEAQKVESEKTEDER